MNFLKDIYDYTTVSLNDKYDAICCKIQFYLIFYVYQYILMDKNIYFHNFFLLLWPMFRLAWPSDTCMHFENNLDYDQF